LAQPPAQLRTRASSINRALDEIGDKWCLLVFQEVFWGINTFNDMLAATGVSRGVLANRLQWLQNVDCLRKSVDGGRPRYHLTAKSVELYGAALMAIAWERHWHHTPALDDIALVHRVCGQAFEPEMRCDSCATRVVANAVSFMPGPGATEDLRDKKIRRRSSIAVAQVPSRHALYRNLINLVGDRWTANIIALAFHGLKRFDAFHAELPVATNILSDRLRLLVAEGVFSQQPYQQRPLRHEYHLTERGSDLFPWFMALQQWGDRWCDHRGKGPPIRVTHEDCGRQLSASVCCNCCGGALQSHEVSFTLDGRQAAL
jgi:DNA-binding HxlR family transcriptional regulator